MTPPRKPAAEDEANARVLETTRELQAMLDSAPPGEPGWDVYLSMMQVHEGVHEAEAALLSELLDLVLPDMKRKASPLLSQLTEGESEHPHPGAKLEDWTGSIGTRARQADWLTRPGIRLTMQLSTCGFLGAKPEDTGAVTSHSLFALADGRLALVDMVGTWHVVDRYVQYHRQVADARLLTPREAVETFPLHELLSALHDSLWDKPLAQKNKKPWGADIEARRARFNVLISDLGQATRAHAERLRRVGDNPP